jgi:hypothetical protein
MSPNHYFAVDDNGTLGVYYNGNAPVYSFDDEYLIDDLGGCLLTYHVRAYIYDHIEENGGRQLLYAFDGGMENGIDEANGFISEAAEAYLETSNAEKIALNKKALINLKKEEDELAPKVEDSNTMYTKIKKHMSDIIRLEGSEWNKGVIDEYFNSIEEVMRKYTLRAQQLRRDIQDETQWELPVGEYDEEDEGGEEDEEGILDKLDDEDEEDSDE